jgi:hypothetical protein
MTTLDWLTSFDWWAFLLHAYAIAGAIVAIAASACRLHKMHPRKSTKWSWVALYCAAFALAWYALALLLAGQATTFEQSVCVLAGGYMLATIDSWRQVPLVAQKSKGDTQ